MAKCMREHGIDMPDPKPGSDGRALTIEPGGKSQEELSAALKECGKSSGAGGANTDANGELTQEFKDQQLKYAQCMREKGIDMPDPKFDGGMQAAQAMPMDEAGKQKFEDANKACGAGGPAGDAADEAK
jgi:hypothetical protein